MIDDLNISNLNSFDNFSILDSCIKGKRIVLLGESSHTTKEYSLTKLKLIKYLHEKQKFHILLFESGIADCYYANELKSQKDSSWLLTHSIFTIWWSKETLQLMTYIKNENIQLAGIDYQLSSSANSEFLKLLEPIDKEYLRKIYSDDTIFSKYASRLTLESDMQDKKHDSMKLIANRLSHYYDVLNEKINDNANIDDKSKLIYKRIILNKQFLLKNFDRRTKLFNLRDSMMSANITWFCDTLYKDEKIIIWAANEHISKEHSSSFNHVYSGAILPERIKKESYVIGIYAYSGEMYSYPSNFNIKTPSRKSLEGRIHSIKKGNKDVFIDLTGIKDNNEYRWVSEKIRSYSWGNYIDYIIPVKFYDAIILINHVTLNRNYKSIK